MNNLSPEQRRILFEKGTEAPFSGEYYHHDEKGDYRCASCGNLLFHSDTKYDSGSGWPSFWDAANPDSITRHEDSSHGMHRVEVRCAQCGGHLGHVFPDGPSEKTGERYCINSLALRFEEGNGE